jgi:cytochrome oxidase Cu insertion factor (SCO1/SenC/PrrC family)
MAKSFRVYFTDVDKGEDGEGEDYLVDHSIVMYLMRPDGTLAEFYTQLMTSAEIAGRVEKVLRLKS